MNGKKKVMEVHTEDLTAYFNGMEYNRFLRNIKTNAQRYVEMFSEAADKIELEKETPNDQIDEFDNALNQFRMNSLKNREGGKINPAGEKLMKFLKRSFKLVIVPGPNCKRRPIPLRQLRSDKIGSLIETRAMVVRVSEVKPVIKVACYLCETCGYEIYQKVNSKDYNPVVECPAEICKNNGVKGRILPNFAVSKFEKYQEIKVQETSDQTPMGSIPRAYTVIAKGDLTRKCVPGDVVKLSGVFLPHQPDKKRRFRDALVHVRNKILASLMTSFVLFLSFYCFFWIFSNFLGHLCGGVSDRAGEEDLREHQLR